MNNHEIIYYPTEKDILELIELDKLVYTNNNIGTFDKCKEWLSVNPNIYTILKHNNKIIGYINFFPVTNECYNKIKSGAMKDYEIKASDLAKFITNKPQKCLFDSIVIHPDFQTGTALIKLWNGFIKKLKSLNAQVSSVIMDCVSEIGERSAIKTLNAKFITNSINGKIYEGTLDHILKNKVGDFICKKK